MVERFNKLSAAQRWMGLAVLLAVFGAMLDLLRVETIPPWLGFAAIAGAGLVALWQQTSAPSPSGPNNPPRTIPATEQLTQTTHMLVRALDSINRVTTQQSAGAREQAEVIERTNTLLNHLVELSERVQEQARTLNATARQAAESSESGSSAINQAMSGMTDIRERVLAIAETIKTLAQFARRIDAIIGSVGEIATQSNLLAVNASIEAARAGVHGRGFAIVADEVRSLSHQSTQSAGQVRAILEEIQTAMKQAIRATEDGLGAVENGLTVAGQADLVMAQLADNVTSAQQAVQQVYEIIRQQGDGLDEITIGIERVERVTQNNLESTRAVETIAGELTRLSGDLQAALSSNGWSS
ncbi:MAG: methyl-accepting chemotaxis protein [Anaerolineae bacterium]